MALGDFLFPHADLKLIVAKSFETDVESVKDKFSAAYRDSAAVVRLNGGDLKRLGLKEGNTASLKTKTGNIIVKTK